MASYCLFPVLLEAQERTVTLHGYMESRFYALFRDDAVFSRLHNTARIGELNRARIRIDAQPSERVRADLAVDYFTYHGFFRERAGILDPSSRESAGSLDQLIRVDRANVQFLFSSLDVTLGLQRISWGRSMLWSPFDVFRRTNILNPQEEIRGVNALKVIIPFTQLTTLQAIYQPEETIASSPAGLRLMTTAGLTDIAGTVIHNQDVFSEQIIYGFDLKGEVYIGWWFELAWYRDELLISRSKSQFIRSTAGIDYTIGVGNGLYLMSEYYRDGSGDSDGNYDYSQMLSGRRFTLASDYLFSSANYPLSQVFSLQYSVVGNLNDGTMIHIPSCRWEFLPNCEVTIGGNFMAGPTGGEFHPLIREGQLELTGNHAVYLWLRIYF